MTGDIWVVAEHWRGEPTDAGYEGLALGRELAGGLGGRLVAVVMGHGAETLAGRYGAADEVLLLESPDPMEGEYGAGARALAGLMAERRPAAVLVMLTNLSWDLAGMLPAASGAPYVNACRDLGAGPDGIEASCVLYGGKMEATVRIAEGPAVFGVLPGVRPADAGRGEGTPGIDRQEIAADARAVRFLEYVEPEAGDVDITREDVLVAVGRGLQGEANLDLAEELAELLGGAVCGSRPAIDQGWLPMSRQVGKSGQQVKPKLYLALGISGAPEHVEGMRDAELIVAVNTDRDAPIFRVAHVGVEADVLDLVPELIDRLEDRAT